MNILQFLQLNAQWICAIGMLVFAGVQVWLMFVQSRQQIRLQRLKLAQELNRACVHFPYSKKDCIKIMDWVMGHGASFAFLLSSTDMKKYWTLYKMIYELQLCDNEFYFEDMKKHEEFYGCVEALESALREASYGIPKYDKKRKGYANK